MERPLVSIVIPTKNRCVLLEQTLRSVRGQTYSNWEAIVIDDGSSDGTQGVLDKTALADGRVRFARRERQPAGAPACRNIGLSLAKGEYLLFLDSDDLLAPHCIERRVSVLSQSSEMDFVVFLTRVFHTAPGDCELMWNVFTPESDLDRFLRSDQPWCTFGPLWKTASLRKLAGWDERALCAQDWEFHIRALAAGLNFLKISEPDSFCRTPTPGTVGSRWTSARYVCNRARLIKRVAVCLHSRGLLNRRRRRILAGAFFEHAFRSGVGRRPALAIWRAGRRVDAVGPFEFVTALASELAAWGTRRFGRALERRLFPEWHLARTHMAPVNPPRRLDEQRLERETELDNGCRK